MRGIFRNSLKGAHRLGPHLVEVGAQARNAFGIQLVKPACSGPGVGHQAGILQHAQMLRYGGAADGQSSRQFVHGNRSRRELLKDGHAGGIAQCIKSGL